MYNHLKKTFSWLSLSVFSGVASLSFLPPAQAQPFSDIRGHWAQNCIGQLAQRQIVSGYPNNTFRPDDIITRAEYAAMMNQAFPDIGYTRGPINFRDVSYNYWGREAIRTAYRKGFLSGYPNQQFKPNQLIPRVQAFVALASGLSYSVPGNTNQILSGTYQDSVKIPDYARGKIAAATEKGIVISPPKPQFDQRLMGPSEPATRAQVAGALCQIKNVGAVPDQYVVDSRTQPSNPGQPVGPITLGQACTNQEIGYRVSYPNTWQTNSGVVLNPCRVFDAGEIQLEDATEDFDEAVYIRREDIPYDRLANLDDPSTRTLSRQQTTVDGRPAVIIESEATGTGLFPQGRRYYRYLVDLGSKTLVAVTYDIPKLDYERNKQVLDKIMNSFKWN